MTAQLVLQFVTDGDLDSYDKLIRFEELLISLLEQAPQWMATIAGPAR